MRVFSIVQGDRIGRTVLKPRRSYVKGFMKDISPFCYKFCYSIEPHEKCLSRKIIEKFKRWSDLVAVAKYTFVTKKYGERGYERRGWWSSFDVVVFDETMKPNEWLLLNIDLILVDLPSINQELLVRQMREYINALSIFLADSHGQTWEGFYSLIALSQKGQFITGIGKWFNLNSQTANK